MTDKEIEFTVFNAPHEWERNGSSNNVEAGEVESDDSLLDELLENPEFRHIAIRFQRSIPDIELKSSINGILHHFNVVGLLIS